MKYLVFIQLFILCFISLANAQEKAWVVKGRVVNKYQPIQYAQVYLPEFGLGTLTDSSGYFEITVQTQLKTIKVEIHAIGYHDVYVSIERDFLRSANHVSIFELESKTLLLPSIIVENRDEAGLVQTPRGVQFSSILHAKKASEILVNQLVVNKLNNNSRQLFATIPGLNIWESDAGGLQLGIGVRGLDPSRSSNFNVRQNGCDISADPLGYPESYYTPPADMIDKIELVKGAASLQYGPQFGGLLNFITKRPSILPFELKIKQGAGSYGYRNSTVSFSGTRNRFSFYQFAQYKGQNGWRPNSQFDALVSFSSIHYAFSTRSWLELTYTHERYLAQQAGGLTDAMFRENPSQSTRARNWFRIRWNLVSADYKFIFTESTNLNIRCFGLAGQRDALGSLVRIDRPDDIEPRTLLNDSFTNIGTEIRVLKRYKINTFHQHFLVGIRAYSGLTRQKQGISTASSEPDFGFANHIPSQFNYVYPGKNLAAFVENVFVLSRRISVSPGYRFEYVSTKAKGSYEQSILIQDRITGLVVDSFFSTTEQRNNDRKFGIAGIGVKYMLRSTRHLNFNFTQNYRPIGFSDIRIQNPNFRIDPMLTDEKGFNSDISISGKSFKNAISYDAGVFFLRYNNRIGSILMVDSNSYQLYRYRTNIGASNHYGIEFFSSFQLDKMIALPSKLKTIFYINLTYLRARYAIAENKAVDGNKVEMAPPFSGKAGLQGSFKRWKGSLQYSYVAQQFSDASNAKLVASAVEGIIPSYQVWDLNITYEYRRMNLGLSANNLLNTLYFTRRASAYPGPGIIPAEPRSIFLSMQITLSKKKVS